MDKMLYISNYFYVAYLLFYGYYFVANLEMRKEKPYEKSSLFVVDLTILDDENSNVARRTVIYQVIILAYVVLIFFSNGLLQMIMPDDIRVLRSGTYSYYVKYENENGKKYYLPAEINVYDEPTEDDDEDKSKYYLHKVYFSKNQYITFEPTSVYIDKKTYISYYDKSDYEHEITITLKNNRVFGKNYVKDDNHLSTVAIIIFVLKLIMLIQIIVAVFWYGYRNSKERND